MISHNSFIWIVVYLSIGSGLLSVAFLYFLPRNWIARSAISADSYKGVPLPWRFANSLGRAVWCATYVSAAVLLVALLAGFVMEESQI